MNFTRVPFKKKLFVNLKKKAAELNVLIKKYMSDCVFLNDVFTFK